MTTTKRTRMAAWLAGDGLEIGALHRPLAVPSTARVQYVDRMDEQTLREHYPELSGEALVPISFLGDATDLSAVPSDSLDFVIANHLLEHLEDPARGISEMRRVLRHGGILYVALPDPRRTFDRARPLTTVEHLLDEWHHGTQATREAHFREWVEYVDPGAAPTTAGADAGTGSAGPRSLQWLMDNDYSIHFHVWRPDTFLSFWLAVAAETGQEWELLDFAGCTPEDNEFIFVFRKGVQDRPARRPEPVPTLRDVVRATPAGDLLRRVERATGPARRAMTLRRAGSQV